MQTLLAVAAIAFSGGGGAQKGLPAKRTRAPARSLFAGTCAPPTLLQWGGRFHRRLSWKPPSHWGGPLPSGDGPPGRGGLRDRGHPPRTLQVGVNPPWWWCCPPVAATLLAAHGQAGPVPLLRVNGLPSWQGRTPLTVALPSHNPPGRGRQTTPVAAPLPEIPASLQILIPPPSPIMELAED